jgi:Fanconi anemia group M protein
MRMAESFDGLHPKFSRTRILLAETLGIEGGDRVIVFTESRDTAEALTDFLAESFAVRKFVGQGDKEGSDGMTQKQQQETLDAFRNGEFEVLVSTSVAEEGLDVPEVDLVLFFEPVPTAIRSIQRKGRTGRQTEGRVVVLMAEDTRDEAYFWISRRREQEMEDELKALKSVAGEMEEQLDDSQQSLDAFDEKRAASNGGDGGGSGDATATAESEDGTTGVASAGNAGGQNGQPGLTDFAGESGSSTTDGDATGAGDDDEDAADGDADTDASDTNDEPEGLVATAEASEDGTVELVIDQRELDSTIARDLSTREGITTRLETLAVGDYVCSDRVAVERKSVDDFLDTLTGGDRSLFEQVGDLARSYARPILVLEGEELYEKRNVHPNAIRGALSSLAVDFDVSVLRTTDQADTADLLEVIARREQETAERSVQVHGEKSAKTLAEQQEYVVSSIADIGPVTARALLAAFGTVEGVMTAREEDLLEVQGVGQVTADRIREVVGSDYER